jgi:hypothetical protein
VKKEQGIIFTEYIIPKCNYSNEDDSNVTRKGMLKWDLLSQWITPQPHSPSSSHRRKTKHKKSKMVRLWSNTKLRLLQN